MIDILVTGWVMNFFAFVGFVIYMSWQTTNLYDIQALHYFEYRRNYKGRGKGFLFALVPYALVFRIASRIDKYRNIRKKNSKTMEGSNLYYCSLIEFMESVE